MRVLYIGYGIALKHCFKVVLFFLFSVLFLISCSDKSDSLPLIERKVFIDASSYDVSNPVTKSVISGDFLDKVLWCETDKVSLYWRNAGSQEALSSAEFHYYRSYKDEATFAATLQSQIPEGSYDYFAVSPVPQSLDGNVAKFEIPAVQNGTYDATAENYAIMVARPNLGYPALSGESSMKMEFVQKCHVMRIQVPTGRNRWGADIRRLRIEFPENVVGTLSVDLTDPDAVPVLSDASSTIDVRLSRSLKESEEDAPDGCYVWVFIAPCELKGDLKFTAYSIDGFQSETLAVTLDKTALAGHITPVNLTIPNELPVTWLDFSVVANNLGEDVQKIKIKAPEGALFRNGTSEYLFDVNEQNSYQVGFYAAYDGIDNASKFRGSSLEVEYESQNAIVSSVNAVPQFENQGRSSVELTVPYLFYEDFSSTSSVDGSNKTWTLENYGLPGWSGSNFAISGGQAIRLHMYAGTINGLGTGDIRRGRMDTPFMTGLKEGVEVTVKVSFNYNGTMVQSSVFNKKKTMYSQFNFGKDKRRGSIAYEEKIEEIVDGNVNAGDKNVAEGGGFSGSYSNITYSRNYDIQSVTRNDRFSWQSTYLVEGTNGVAITAKTVYVYIDNIKVSIKNN